MNCCSSCFISLCLSALTRPAEKYAGSHFDGATLDRIQQSVTVATNGEIVIPDSLRTIYETTGGTPFLDGQYTVFGRVTEGLEVVEAIQGVATDSAGRPLEDVRIIRAEAVRK